MKKVVQDLGFVIRYEQLAPHVAGKQGARKRIMHYVPVAKSDYPEVLAQVMAEYGFKENEMLIPADSDDIFAAQARPKLEEEEEKKGKRVGKTLLELYVSAVGIVDLLVDVPDPTPVSDEAPASES